MHASKLAQMRVYCKRCFLGVTEIFLFLVVGGGKRECYVMGLELPGGNSVEFSSGGRGGV